MEKKEIIMKYRLEEICQGKALIGFESWEDAERVKNILGGELTHFTKKAGQYWRPKGLRSAAYEPYKLDAEDIGYVSMYGKGSVVSCIAFYDEIGQCADMLSKELDEAEMIEETDPILSNLATLCKVIRLFSDMPDDEVLLLGDSWMEVENYKTMPKSELTTMSYEYDSTQYAIGLTNFND